MDARYGQMEAIRSLMLRKNRFFVTTNLGTTPRANYVWLKNNPSFKKIPKGYVIHHLDHDPTNDDPSNLVLMLKFHHMAYHFKKLNVNVPVSFVDDNPVRRPYICLEKSRGVYYILCWGDNGTGLKKYRTWRDEDGNFFKTKESAQEYVKRKWPV